jgi:hypothetical protein
MEEHEATYGQRLTATLRQQGDAGIITIAWVSRKSKRLPSVITGFGCKGRGQSTTLRAVAEQRTIQLDVSEESQGQVTLCMCVCVCVCVCVCERTKMHCPLTATVD